MKYPVIRKVDPVLSDRETVTVSSGRLFNLDGQSVVKFVAVRSGGEFAGKAFYLNPVDGCHFELGCDTEGTIILVPVKG